MKRTTMAKKQCKISNIIVELVTYHDLDENANELYDREVNAIERTLRRSGKKVFEQSVLDYMKSLHIPGFNYDFDDIATIIIGYNRGETITIDELRQQMKPVIKELDGWAEFNMQDDLGSSRRAMMSTYTSDKTLEYIVSQLT